MPTKSSLSQAPTACMPTTAQPGAYAYSAARPYSTKDAKCRARAVVGLYHQSFHLLCAKYWDLGAYQPLGREGSKAPHAPAAKWRTRSYACL